MICNNCGNVIESGKQYCGKCGNYIGNAFNNGYMSNNYNNIIYNKKKKFPVWVIIIITVQLIFWLIIGVVVYKVNDDYYYTYNSYSNDYVPDENYPNIYDDGEEENPVINDNEETVTSSNRTKIVYDHVYRGVNISSIQDANKLIEKDSTSQKNGCSEEIKQVENELITKYNITAVNLCEMNAGYARELGNVIEKIYDEFPSARGHITNMTLYNTGMSESGIIAAFMPVFQFASSSSSSSYPWVIKTHLLLTARYFLNPELLDNDVKTSASGGHFPPNSNKYSPVAHELGHYLSFLGMMKYYNIDSILLINNNNADKLYKLVNDFAKGDYSLSLLNEAYENYKRDTGSNIDFDSWRGTISGYALAKDNNGSYIYDETIAEAFHDIYLNGHNSKDASKYIVNVLKSRLNK